VWTICFVDIAVSYDFFVLLCSELIFFLFITLYCLPLMLVNKADNGLVSEMIVSELICQGKVQAAM